MKRTVTCTVVGVLALLGLWALTPNMRYEPQGIILPAKTVRAPISAEHVVVYHAVPANTKNLGQIRVEFAFQELNTDTHDQLFAEVKSLAANVGANGVVVNYLAPGDGVRKVLTFIGTAIYVPGSAKP